MLSMKLAAALCGAMMASDDTVLNRGDSAATVRGAEQRLAALHRPDHTGSTLGPQWTADPDSPPVGKHLTFRLKFEGLEPGPTQPDGSPGPLKLVGSLNAALSKVFTLEDIDPQAADEIRQASAEVEILNRRLDDNRDRLSDLKGLQRDQRRIGSYRITYGTHSPCGHYGHCDCAHHGHDRYCQQRFCGYGRHGCRHAGPCPPCTCRYYYRDYSDLFATEREIAELEQQIDDDRLTRDRLKGEIGQARRAFREALENARHTVVVVPPADWAAPAKMPRNFTAKVRIDRVLWDASATLPTLQLEGLLLQLQ